MDDSDSDPMTFIKYKGFDHLWKYTGPWLWWLLGLYFWLPVLAYIVLPYFTSKRRFSKKKSATLFVLGDIGHSPRMCYHARSLAKLDYYVTLCGYLETFPPEDIVDDENIDIQLIDPIRNTLGLPFIAFAAQKIVLQCFQLFNLLVEYGCADYIIIQNPPLIPILILAIIYKKLLSRDTQIVIDWHNLNYSILNLKYQNEGHPLVRFLKSYEKYVGRWADHHITVTVQMKQFLVKEFGLSSKRITTLHDRPAEGFEPLVSMGISQLEVLRNHELFESVGDEISKYRILVSSTSFTPDEDFNVLLDALKMYDQDINLPPVLLVVTGKGPLKEQFHKRAEQLQFLNRVIIKTAWLSFEDYPLILAAADLAVSLHTSSSGIDLPMKIVDFFGCGVPVITMDFPAIGELVKDGVNGLVVKNKADPAQEIFRLLQEALTNDELLPRITNGALKESKLRWDENWDNNLGNYFK